MKLAILTSSLAPYPISGAERQAAGTAIRLAEMGHEVTVFARHMLSDQPSVVEHDGVRWVRCHTVQQLMVRFPSHILGFLRQWKRESARGPFDCILAYSMVINGILGRLASMRSGVPMVLWVRNESEILLRRSKKFHWLSPWVLKHSDHVLTQAESIQREMILELKAVGKRKIADWVSEHSSVLQNAVTLGADPEYENREGLIFVGRLVAVKGLEILFQAMRRLSDPPELQVLGDGPLRRELELASEGLPVRFHGYRRPEEVREYLSRARILVAPSFVEGFPNVILEAMAVGVPAIASDVGGVKSLVRDGHNGYLIQAGSVEKLAQRMERLSKDEPLWRTLARNARRTAGRFAWEPHLRRLVTVLQTTVKESQT